MRRVITSLLVLALSGAACGQGPDSDSATPAFVECLERNGIEAQDVEVVLNANGSVGSISAVIVSEGDVAYEPTVRFACTEEVENR